MLKGVTGLRWRPGEGSEYWYIISTGLIVGDTWREIEILIHEYRYRTGNCFKTVEEAEAYYDSVMTD